MSVIDLQTPQNFSYKPMALSHSPHFMALHDPEPFFTVVSQTNPLNILPYHLF